MPTKGMSRLDRLSKRTMNLSSTKGLLASGLLGAATVLAVATGCSRDNVAQAAPAPAEAQAATQVQDDAAPYDLKTDVKGECKVGAECVATITISAKGDYHVNKDYPFKFTASGQNVEFHGASGNVFTGGDFARQEKSGTMTVKFKPTAKGKITISGPYKICICTDKICQPSTTNVSFTVDVK